MESVSVGSPGTPDRTTSAGPSPPRRNPMEDADSSVTRKRPRLDSGTLAYTSMSVDRSTATPPGPETSQGTLTPAHDDSSSVISEQQHALPGLDRTPSKVTINVRDPIQRSSPPLPITNGIGVTSPQGREEPPAFHSDGPCHITESPPSNVISVSSSPARSPEIEVAELEDMNEESRETRWRPLVSLIDAKDTQAALLDAFPYADRHRDLRQTVSLIAQAFEKHALENGQMLKSLTDWIEMYLQTTEPHSSQWWSMYLDEREFWDDIPMIIEGLLRRSSGRYGTASVLPARPDEYPDTHQHFQSFLVAFAGLTSRMAQIDCQTLEDFADDSRAVPDLIANRYLTALQYLVASAGSTLWKSLYDTYNYDYLSTITAIISRFVHKPSNGMSCLLHIVKGLLDRSQAIPSMTNRLWSPLKISIHLMQHYNLLRESDDEVYNRLAHTLDQLPAEAYDLFQVVDTSLQTFISKQVSALSIETSQCFVNHLSLLLISITHADEQLSTSILREKLHVMQDFSEVDNTVIVELAWKFHLLKKCIMEGRMEIRVQGVETMQQELVTAYQKYIQPSKLGSAHAVAQYLSDFLLANKLIEYFVGVESHPQLIGRCQNIVGFLVIANRYTDATSDAIWKAVASSQDSRVIDAILTMLNGFLHLSSYPTVLYLTQKLNELPLHTFDLSMIIYSERLLDRLRIAWRDQRSETRMDMPPYHLCIRLVRQSAAEESLPYHKKRDINQFALIQLQHLLFLGPSDADRKTIYEECINDVACRTRFATGSISAINALLRQNPEQDIRSLSRHSDLTNLIIEEFAHMVENEPRSTSTSGTLDERLPVRLELLQSIILHIPETISPEIGQRLWNVMFGPRALSDRARSLAWHMLGRASRICMRENPFIDRCISEYLPQLNPVFITIGILSFVEQVPHYEARLAHLRVNEEQHQIRSMGAELLWHLSLVALPGSIERKTIHMLVSLYLDSPGIQNTSQSAIEAMHIDVVERCIRQLTAAASRLKAFSDGTSSGEDEPMVIVASEGEVQSQRLDFTRSLLILREFVQGVRSRPVHSPSATARLQLSRDSREAKGDLIRIRYQSFSGGTNTGIHSIDVGELETIDELSHRLIKLTGFSKFIAIAGGQKLDLSSNSKSTLRDMKFDQKGLLIIKKTQDADPLPESGSPPGLRPLEVEVMEHFSVLYELLDMEESLAKEVFEFLSAFPPHVSITKIVCSKDISRQTAFPRSSQFKVLYSVYALKLCLIHQGQNGTINEAFICHGVQLLALTLTSEDKLGASADTEIDVSTAAGLVDCLLLFLKEAVSLGISGTLLSDAAALIERLLWFITFAESDSSSSQGIELVCKSFAALLEVSLHCSRAWNYFKNTDKSSMRLQRLLLEDPKLEIRQGIADAIQGICYSLPSRLVKAPAQDFMLYFWVKCAAIIPQSLEHGYKSQQLFDVLYCLSQTLDQTSQGNIDLERYTKDWSDLLLTHKHTEFAGRESVDWVVLGISRLLHWCIETTRVSKKPMNADNHALAERLLRAHLFPELSNLCEDALITVRIPTLHSQTRQELYSIILALGNDILGYQRLLKLVKELLLQGEETSHAWTWGIAQILEDYTFDLNWNFSRLKSIRSPVGYPGLRNLSNTCYMNSLFTQLFMNVSFRGFILDTNVADGNSSQKLLSETKKLFAFMQESVCRSVDTQGIADSVINYENTLIDVSVQMDVDEFYNLLFDRLESQILSDEGKRRFRKFYGGQIVQQIKSKECPHISERIEPFSAIQCDIQGKTTLIESLNAYVGGEVMEGDNKYSCTSCGSYVDAVKRACLKDIPDNLIFHLKRFDYDISTGMRNKINDRFEFPEQIDMAPYHVEYLKDPKQPPNSDMFGLTGILVHSGTAESGHYYSYTRERPIDCRQGPNWVEFNDSDVSRFNPKNIPDQCFGGESDTPPYSTACFPKAWNAYMLFYQRITAMDVELERHHPAATDVPVKEEIPLDIGKMVAVQNEHFIRKYCLFDPAHTAFARCLLEQLRLITQGTCSNDHAIEREAIWLALDHLDQVLSRTKDCAGFDTMLTSLSRVIGTCPTCCRLALDWVVCHKQSLRNLLLRCPNAKVRKEFAMMILTGLLYLRKHDTRTYGFDVDSIECDPTDGNLPESQGILQDMVTCLRELWVFVHMSIRAWDDYFGLLTEIANLGIPEIHVMLRADFLKLCLEILIVEHPNANRIRRDSPHYVHYMRLLEKGRRFSFIKLIDLVRILLSTIDLERRPADIQNEDRALVSGKMGLSIGEDTYMRFGILDGRAKSLIFLEKILNLDQNPQAASEIIRMMVLAEPGAGAIQDVLKTILSGVNVEPASLAGPFLSAAITLCEVCPQPTHAKEIVYGIANEVDSIGLNGGLEHLQFFVKARRLQNLRFQRTSPQFFHRMILQTVPRWAPALVMYWDEPVRLGTIDLLRTLVFNRDHRNMDNEQEAEELERVARQLCAACVKRIQDFFVQQQKPVENKNVENVTQVIRHCLQNYYSTDPGEDDHDSVLEAETVLDALQQLTVSDADDANSDTWNNQDSDLPTDSESENILASP